MDERGRPQAPFFARVVLVLVTCALYIPLLCVSISSFHGIGEWGLQWYRQVFEDPTLIEAMGNSLFVAVASSALATAFGTGAAIAIAQGRFRGRRILEAAGYISLILPEIVFALSLLAWFAILRLTLGLGTVILAHVTFSISYVILTVGARLSTMDPALEDAARDLGASEWTILRKVTLPLLRPSLFASYLLCFLLSFDDFLITFFVNGAGSETLPVKLYATMKTGLTPKLNALASLMWFASAFILILAFRSKTFKTLLKATGESE